MLSVCQKRRSGRLSGRGRCFRRVCPDGARFERSVVSTTRRADGLSIHGRHAGTTSSDFTRPHEPAGTASCFEVYRRLVVDPDLWSESVLAQFWISFLCDANPTGSPRVHVKFWEGSQYPNETPCLWMSGGDKAQRQANGAACGILGRNECHCAANSVDRIGTNQCAYLCRAKRGSPLHVLQALL